METILSLGIRNEKGSLTSAGCGNPSFTIQHAYPKQRKKQNNGTGGVGKIYWLDRFVSNEHPVVCQFMYQWSKDGDNNPPPATKISLLPPGGSARLAIVWSFYGPRIQWYG